jgi:hypothetical protein
LYPRGGEKGKEAKDVIEMVDHAQMRKEDEP